MTRITGTFTVIWLIAAALMPANDSEAVGLSDDWTCPACGSTVQPGRNATTGHHLPLHVSY